MNSQWMTVRYLTQRASLERLLPPGFELRGDPIVSVSLSFFHNLYWLAGRGYGILYVDFPVVYTGKTETIAGAFCPVLWEGMPDAILTGREELGFPKLFADIPSLKIDTQRGAASGDASWLGHKFFEIELHGLKEAAGEKRLPGSDGPALHFRYLPRTSPGGSEGHDVAYVTTSQPLPGTAGGDSPIMFQDSNFKRWRGDGGTVKFHRATFQQLPTTFHVVNGLADLRIVDYVSAEMVEFSAPGIAVSANSFRTVAPAA